ncbi:MAG: DUF971 domain-containing protein [Ignavibacteria bacterium]|nr:DUF971 domain-containing protein [Ignavibacteria bacterium]
MNAKQIKVENKQLIITWMDDSSWQFSLELLRNECPCAGCKGETILLHTYAPTEKKLSDLSYKIAGIQPVGGYAIAIQWKDGHDTGIYSWDYLQKLIAR